MMQDTEDGQEQNGLRRRRFHFLTAWAVIKGESIQLNSWITPHDYIIYYNGREAFEVQAESSSHTLFSSKEIQAVQVLQVCCGKWAYIYIYRTQISQVAFIQFECSTFYVLYNLYNQLPSVPTTGPFDVSADTPGIRSHNYATSGKAQIRRVGIFAISLELSKFYIFS